MSNGCLIKCFCSVLLFLIAQSAFATFAYSQDITLDGYVRYSTGEPAAGVTVTMTKNIYVESPPVITSETTTADSGGYYSFQSEPRCGVEYTFQAVSSQTVDGDSLPPASTSISGCVTSNVTLPNIEIPKPASITLGGYVTDQFGTPVQGLTVTMTRTKYDLSPPAITTATITTDGSGHYQFGTYSRCSVEEVFKGSIGANVFPGGTSISGCVGASYDNLNFSITLGSLEDAGRMSCNKGVGGPVSVTSGNVYFQQRDYQLPGIGEGISITRDYNSISQKIGLFGRGWTSAYDEVVLTNANNQMELTLPDGRLVSFATPNFFGQVTKNADASYTVVFKDGRVHRFNSSGKLISLVDRNGNQTFLTYVSGRLSSITDPFGRVLNVATNANGRVLSISDSLGTIASYTYGASNELLTVSYADNSKNNFSYVSVPSGLALASVTDALGNVIEQHDYDARGRGITSQAHGGVGKYTLSYVSATETDVTDALGRVTKYFFHRVKASTVVDRIEGLCGCGGGSQTQSWTYDSQMNVASHTNALNQTVTYTYDMNGNELSGTGVLGTSTFTYNQFGEVLTATDAMNGVTTNTYDAAGNLSSVTDALDNAANFTYDVRGELLTMTNARGKVTTLAYDTKGNIGQTTDALANITKFVYDARGRLTSATDALNFATSYAYDAAGRLNKITRADGSIISFTYDLAGRRTKVTDPLKFSTTFAYDSAYRLIRETDALSKSVSYSYDLMSNLVAATDQLGHTTNVSYDEFNRPTTITYPAAVTGGARLQETTAYDAVGNVTSRTDTAGRVTNFAYDNANRLISVTDPLLQVTQYEYDARSNVTAVVDALNQRYTFDYDALGRITATTRAGLQMTYAYDAVGNRTQRTDYNNMPTNYEYDALNRLTKTTYPDSATATYLYDKLSQLTSATNLNGTVSFVYDKLGRVTSTTDVSGQAISYAYDVNGRRTQMNLGSTKFATYAYDSINRLTKITDSGNKNTSYTFDAASNLLTRTLSNGVVSTYTYDGMDRLTRLKDAKGTTVIADNNYAYNNASQIVQNIDQSGSHVYGYDALDHLTNASYPATGNEAYAYDAVGNRSSSHRSASYSYQPNNRLTNTDAASYLYDNNGNMTAKSDGAGTTQLVWDFENRLTNVVTPSAGSVTYKYDALGRRIQRTPSNGASTNFSYDGADVVRDKNSDATTIDYLNGPGIDNKIWQKGATQYFFSQDHLGSTTALTNTSGALIEREAYDAYGNTAGSSLTRYGYTGRERDSISGLMYYRARWYDAQIGRFVSEDPIGLAGGINQFGYVNGNPQNGVDPSGLYDVDVHYYLTYHLALRTGCFTDQEAREIAEGDQRSDEDDDKKPAWGKKWEMTWHGPVAVPDTDQQQRNADFHAFGTPEQNAARANQLYTEATQNGGNLHSFGTYLHFEQDSHSHSEFAGNITWGQSSRGEWPDQTSDDPKKAMDMARDTYEKLKRFGEMRGCKCHGDPDWKKVQDFIDVGFGSRNPISFIRGITNDQLRQKIEILGVPWRSPNGR